METKLIRKNTGSTTVIMIIMMIIMLALGGFIAYTQYFGKTADQNKPDEIVEPDNQEPIEEPKDVALTEDDAKELYNKYVKNWLDYSIHKNVEKFPEKGTGSPDYWIEYIIEVNDLTNSSGVDLCADEYKKDLLKKEIIAKEDEGQFDCKEIGKIDADALIEAYKNTINKDFDVTKYKEKNATFYYYEKANVLLDKRCCAVGQEYTYKYKSFEQKEDSLLIYFTIKDEGEPKDSGTYYIKFNKNTNGDYYVDSIVKNK